MKLSYVLLVVVVAVVGLTHGDRCHDTFKDQASCNAEAECVWCLCGALPSACFSIEDSKRLPPAVFDCSTKNPGPTPMAFIKSFMRDYRQQP